MTDLETQIALKLQEMSFYNSIDLGDYYELRNGLRIIFEYGIQEDIITLLKTELDES